MARPPGRRRAGGRGCANGSTLRPRLEVAAGASPRGGPAPRGRRHRLVAAGMVDLVAPRQLPDALYEVKVKGRDEPVHVIIEASTYPERRSVEQARTDALMVLLSKGVLPEVVVFVLCPRGTYQAESSERFTSALGSTRMEVSWRVINLWEV